MNITSPIPFQIPSTYTLNLATNSNILTSLKIIILNPNIAQTITFYDQNGSVEGEPLFFNSSIEIELNYVNYSKITFSDPNTYSILVFIQTLTFSWNEDLNRYQSDANFSIIPLISGNVTVNTTPLQMRTLTGISFTGTTDATVSTALAFTTTPTKVTHFRFTNNGTAVILIGSTNVPNTPIPSGAVFLWDDGINYTDLSTWFTSSASASQPYAVNGEG
jgi:hypothetical protein